MKPEIIEKIKDLPRFKDGRIDYTHAKIAPVISVFLKYKEEILILKRSNKVMAYKGKWCNIGGFLDEIKPLEEKIYEELEEELGINKNSVKSIHLGEQFEYYEEEVDKTWVFHPAVVELKEKPEIKLDWENTDFKWIKPTEFDNYDCVPNLKENYNKTKC